MLHYYNEVQKTVGDCFKEYPLGFKGIRKSDADYDNLRGRIKLSMSLISELGLDYSDLMIRFEKNRYTGGTVVNFFEPRCLKLGSIEIARKFLLKDEQDNILVECDCWEDFARKFRTIRKTLSSTKRAKEVVWECVHSTCYKAKTYNGYSLELNNSPIGWNGVITKNGKEVDKPVFNRSDLNKAKEETLTAWKNLSKGE